MREQTSAGGVLIREDRTILFCHPTGSRWTNWRMPKGQLDRGELPRAAALREVLEETGFRCRIHKKLTTPVVYKTSDRLGRAVMKTLVLYLMEPLEQVQKPDWEHDAFRWVPFASIKKYAATRELPIIEEAIETYETLRENAIKAKKKAAEIASKEKPQKSASQKKNNPSGRR